MENASEQSTATPALRTVGLAKTIQHRRIVEDLNLTVWPGEVFGLLGPNGAGKTTAIRLLTGLIHPTAGTVQIVGYDLRKQFRQAMRHVGCIVENPDLYSYLSGYDNLVHLGRMHGTQTRKRIPEVVEQVKLTERIHDRVKTYSLGMKQRLGIAQALLHNPDLLILDEPTNGLDPVGIRELRVFIRAMAKNGLAVIVSSHALTEMEQVCDRVALIREGRIILTGSVQELTRASSLEDVFFRHTDTQSEEASFPI